MLPKTAWHKTQLPSSVTDYRGYKERTKKSLNSWLFEQNQALYVEKKLYVWRFSIYLKCARSPKMWYYAERLTCCTALSSHFKLSFRNPSMLRWKQHLYRTSAKDAQVGTLEFKTCLLCNVRERMFDSSIPWSVPSHAKKLREMPHGTVTYYTVPWLIIYQFRFPSKVSSPTLARALTETNTQTWNPWKPY